MLKQVLDSIKPSKDEKKEIKEIAKELIGSIKIPKTKVVLGGSLAKNTWLKGNHDIDIYVKFNKKEYLDKDISKILEKKIKKLNPSKIHGSRDYFQIKKEKYIVEIIPILNIKSVNKAKNITDVSPFHTKYVKKYNHLTDDIRLAKAFFKANELYGAESYIRGFSGYAIEVLVIHYRGFKKLLKAVSKWKSPIVIDTLDQYKGRKILTEMNPSKLESPLIVVDPVQKERNVTAVVNQEKFEKFKKAAKDYLDHPSISYFMKKDFDIKPLEKKYKKDKLIILKAKPLEGKKDVVGAKLLKTYNFLLKELSNHNFEIIDSGWHWKNKAYFWFVFNKKQLSKKEKHYGPPKGSKRIENFKKKWGKIKYDKNKSFVIINRKYRKPKELIKELIKDKYIKSRVKSIKTIP